MRGFALSNILYSFVLISLLSPSYYDDGESLALSCLLLRRSAVREVDLDQKAGLKGLNIETKLYTDSLICFQIWRLF